MPSGGHPAPSPLFGISGVSPAGVMGAEQRKSGTVISGERAVSCKRRAASQLSCDSVPNPVGGGHAAGHGKPRMCDTTRESGPGRVTAVPTARPDAVSAGGGVAV